jgi:hypothetical protein
MTKNTRRRFSLHAGAACLAAALALPVGAAGALAAPQDPTQAAAAPAQPTPTPPDPETTPEDTPTEDTPTEDTPTDETTEESPTDETTEESPTDETTEESPTDETTEESPTDETTEESPTETDEGTPLPSPTTPQEAKEEVDELSKDPDTPEEVKGDLDELATLMDEAQNKPAPVQKAAVDISVSVIVAVDAIKSPRTSPADKAALNNCVKELTASVKVIVDVRVSATVRQSLVQVSVDVKVTVQALQAPKVPPKTKTALRGAVQQQTSALKTIRSPGTPQGKKKQLANTTRPIQIVSKIVINVKTSVTVKNEAQQVLVELTVVVKTVQQTGKQPSAKWKACDKALAGLNASTATTIPQQCEGSLR